MSVLQTSFLLAARPRGIHLVTDEVLAHVDLSGARAGVLHLFLRHTSAALALNEDASPSVRRDLARWLDDAIPDGWEAFEHRLEGPDDMPAHVKSVLVGPSLTVPVTDGRPALGTWQGIWLCEFRDHGGPRSVTATLTYEGPARG